MKWKLILMVVVACATMSAGGEDALFPFVLPWDDAGAGVTDLSGWLEKPAGKFGAVRAEKDGHLYAGKQRIRFFGMNIVGPGAFPSHEDADKIAARLAKFGINCVRFHHMDSTWAPLIAYGKGDSRQLEADSLDRLDYLVAQLKARGIYSDVNLLVGRSFRAADGLPAAIEQVDWRDQHVIGFFDGAVQELQKQYARDLLTHRNAYTKLTYAEDPAVAFVEIDNENGLLHAWLGGTVNRLPELFRGELQKQWNAWLQTRHGSTEKLRAAWSENVVPLGGELLTNGEFAHGIAPWFLEKHEGAEARATVTDDGPATIPKCVYVSVSKAGRARWHVQLNQSGLKLQAGQPYSLTFWAKADQPCSISTGVLQAHEPWQALGFNADVDLTPQWKQFRFVFQLHGSDDNARIDLSGLGLRPGSYWFAGVSLRPGGVGGLQAGERLEDGTVPLLAREQFGARTAAAQRDWMRFLWATEDRYWQSLARYLKDDLRVRALVIGTIVGCSTPNLMAKLDAVDAHAYWQHPEFPGRPWDQDNWLVQNRSMVNEAGGTLPDLAMKRVLGKPHCVTEYNHPAPNTFGSEGMLLLAAYGALQDWDAIFAYNYSSRRDDLNARRIPNFFDFDQHPTKMAALLPAIAMFVRGDVQAAKQQVVAPLDLERELDLLPQSQTWGMVDAASVGLAPTVALMHRVAIATGGAARPIAKIPAPATTRWSSDTGELVWDLSAPGHGVVTVNAPNSKAVIGYGGGKRFALGDVVIEPGATQQDGWCAITVTSKPGQWLITATGNAENTGMVWKSAAKNSVGRNWGRAPSLVEGITARIILPAAAGKAQAWALDEHGQRGRALPIESDAAGHAVIEIGAQYKTLWYEVALSP